jgi:hypothetical protein
VRDLLWANSSAPRPVVTIRELPTGVSLAGACERQVNSREEMSHVLMQGTLMRAVAATNMNNRCVGAGPRAGILQQCTASAPVRSTSADGPWPQATGCILHLVLSAIAAGGLSHLLALAAVWVTLLHATLLRVGPVAVTQSSLSPWSSADASWCGRPVRPLQLTARQGAAACR